MKLDIPFIFNSFSLIRSDIFRTDIMIYHIINGYKINQLFGMN
jgi:hypothetical protein